MNAYELPVWQMSVDEVKALIETNRQQADRIAELEECINACYAVQKMQAEEVYKGNDRIAELEKQSKPVAWMEYIQGEEWEVWYVEPTDLPEGHTYKPLYLAPQTKPLNDEEIIAMADSLSLIHYYDSDGEWSGITNEPMFRAEQNRNNERLLEILNPFARAIEERHGIK